MQVGHKIQIQNKHILFSSIRWLIVEKKNVFLHTPEKVLYKAMMMTMMR